ncbi:MAG: hypothetical protein FWD86_02580 [Firmicutes bacterium]|nr:hypothetical protein [Bacillota bacterium]
MAHSVCIENRTGGILSGIENVVSASEDMINLQSTEGSLCIFGKGLKIQKFNIGDGSLTFEGSVDTIKYMAAKLPVFKRIFK